MRVTLHGTPGCVAVPEYVGHGAPGLPASRYANRHRVGIYRVCRHEHDQAGAVASYATDLAERPALVAAARAELAGTELACWCPPGTLYHGDVLIRVVAGAEPVELFTQLGERADQR